MTSMSGIGRWRQVTVVCCAVWALIAVGWGWPVAFIAAEEPLPAAEDQENEAQEAAPRAKPLETPVDEEPSRDIAPPPAESGRSDGRESSPTSLATPVVAIDLR